VLVGDCQRIKSSVKMRKKKKKIVLSSTSEAEKVSIPYLPDDLLLNCLARISRLYYPTLSLVSKRFRSLLASTELYETRRLLGTSESCLYFFMTERRNDHEVYGKVEWCHVVHTLPLFNLSRALSCYHCLSHCFLMIIYIILFSI